MSQASATHLGTAGTASVFHAWHLYFDRLSIQQSIHGCLLVGLTGRIQPACEEQGPASVGKSEPGGGTEEGEDSYTLRQSTVYFSPQDVPV